MYRLILGCNVWNVLLLAVSAWLGLTGARGHVVVSLFAAVFSAAVHGGGVALFMGGGKLVKEHVGRFHLPLDIIERLNVVYHAHIPKAILAAASMPVVGVLGGLVGIGKLPGWLHGGLGIAALAYQVWLVPYQYRWLKRFHGIVQEVERRLPPDEELATTAPHPGYRPDEVVLDARGRARALLFIGLSLPALFVGYAYIAGFPVRWLLIPTVIGTLACLAGALHYHRRSGRWAGRRLD